MFQGWSVFNLVMISDDLLSEKVNDIIMDEETKIILIVFSQLFVFGIFFLKFQ